jgi:hypothetical protein
MKLSDLINRLASKCGKQNDRSVIDLLSYQSLRDIDLSDDVANAVIDGLLTIESAKNNSLLKNHFTALALSAIDTEISNAVKVFALGSDFEKEISGISNTYEKLRKLTLKLKCEIKNLQSIKSGESGNKTICSDDFANNPEKVNIIATKDFIQPILKGKVLIIFSDNESDLKNSISFDGFVYGIPENKSFAENNSE